MAKKMGMQTEQINAEEVIIKTPEKDIVISQPQVSKINMMGQESYQISGEISEKPRNTISDEDIETVINQTGASRGDVEEALKQTQGDLAEAILKLKK